MLLLRKAEWSLKAAKATSTTTALQKASQTSTGLKAQVPAQVLDQDVLRWVTVEAVVDRAGVDVAVRAAVAGAAVVAIAVHADRLSSLRITGRTSIEVWPFYCLRVPLSPPW